MKLSKLTCVLFLLALLMSACQSAQPPATETTPAYPEPVQPSPLPVEGSAYPYPQPGQLPVNPTIIPYPYPSPGQNPQSVANEEIPWDQVEPLLLSGKVTKVMQTHDLNVYLTRSDGRIILTVEPEIDAIFKLIEQCGDPCKAIIIATE